VLLFHSLSVKNINVILHNILVSIKTVVTCKIKHLHENLQNVLVFYFTCIHGLVLEIISRAAAAITQNRQNTEEFY